MNTKQSSKPYERDALNLIESGWWQQVKTTSIQRKAVHYAHRRHWKFTKSTMMIAGQDTCDILQSNTLRTQEALRFHDKNDYDSRSRHLQHTKKHSPNMQKEGVLHYQEQDDRSRSRHLCGAIDRRSICDVRVSRDPSTICCAPKDVSRLVVENILECCRRPNHVPAMEEVTPLDDEWGYNHVHNERITKNLSTFHTCIPQQILPCNCRKAEQASFYHTHLAKQKRTRAHTNAFHLWAHGSNKHARTHTRRYAQEQIYALE